MNDGLKHIWLCLVSCFLILLAGCQGHEEAATEAKSAQVNQCVDDSPQELLLHVDSPDWQEQVIYFLMIDRFSDGDPTNNDQGAGEYAPSKEAYWSGGDIQGIIDKLDYIQELGATAVWLTPPVANQWWSEESDFSGYHGYWATHFKEIDAHYGTLEDYKRLSHELHCRGMYLIQDIVANHTGVFFGYDGEYDPTDTAKNFVWYERDDPIQSAPTMAPFDKVDRLNPEHEQADIYNWTPPISDYSDLGQQYTYQLGVLSDLNTKNPEVLATFKDAYSYWIEEVGVDAFRVDTVKYVEHEFWHQFFHDDDGVFSAAKASGKEHFLAFGEIFDYSKPFQNEGEKKVVSYLGTAEKPELNSVIGFPLQQEIDNVFAGGQPTNQMAYRLDQFMEIYPDPFVVPNFVDNHDTKRFLAAGNIKSFKQALSVLFTIPGIPIIYQGTEQAHTHTRQAMFAGGFHGHDGYFNTDSELYQFIQKLIDIRKANPVLIRGQMEQVASAETGQGILAYRRDLGEESILVVFNTADHGILVNAMQTGLNPGQSLNDVLIPGQEPLYVVDAQGQISMELPARAILILKAGDEVETKLEKSAAEINFTFDQNLAEQVLSKDFTLSGRVSAPSVDLKLIVNGNLDRAMPLQADAEGRWSANLTVRDLGEATNSAVLYAPNTQSVSQPIYYRTQIDQAELSGSIADGKNDARGPNGKYIGPQHEASRGQREIEAVSYRAAGANLELTLKMQEVTDVWVPANGFDNVSISTFISLPGENGWTVLPLLNGDMPDGLEWNIAHVVYGWGNYTYSKQGASAQEQGFKIGFAPKITVDKESGTIKIYFQGDRIGIESWEGVTFYITTWDATGEGAYRELFEEPNAWGFSGPDVSSPRIMDDVLIKVGRQ